MILQIAVAYLSTAWATVGLCRERVVVASCRRELLGVSTVEGPALVLVDCSDHCAKRMWKALVRKRGRLDLGF
jgi:hypothetical protein